MFGIKRLQYLPSEYILRYKSGRLVSQGAGLSFFCYIPTTAVTKIPTSSIDVPFIFEEITSDYQAVTLQGQLVFRIVDPIKAAQMLDFNVTLPKMSYSSDDPQKLPQRIIDTAKVLAKKHLALMTLLQAVKAGENLAQIILQELRESETCLNLGLEILSFEVLAVLANRETARALEANTREQVLKTADDAVYERRNASIKQERIIKENEYNTEISVEQKKFQVQQEKLKAEQSVQSTKNQIREEQLLAEIRLEEKRKELAELAAENSRIEADARAYALKAAMQSLQGVDAAVIHSLASMGMQPDKLMAMAFQGLAGNAEKIGQLNITPDLLSQIVQGGAVNGSNVREKNSPHPAKDKA